MIDQMKEKYSVGALLYSPALNGKIAESVISERFGKAYSLALCLEDTIADNSVSMAEDQGVSSGVSEQTVLSAEDFCPCQIQ